MIHGLSERRDFPRAGKIKIGERILSKNDREIPSKLDYFKFVPIDESLQEDWLNLYGPEPKSIPVVLPSDDPGEAFPQELRRWGGNNKIQCHGDNRTAQERTEGGWQQIPCNENCPHRQATVNDKGYEKAASCKPEGTLRVILPELPTLGTFELKAAMLSIIRINSSLALIRGSCSRLMGIPLTLSLVPVTGPKGAIYVYHLDAAISYQQLMESPKTTALPESKATNGKEPPCDRFLRRCAEIKAGLGEEGYYLALENLGLQHASEVDKGDTGTMSNVINLLLEFLQDDEPDGPGDHGAPLPSEAPPEDEGKTGTEDSQEMIDLRKDTLDLINELEERQRPVRKDDMAKMLTVGRLKTFKASIEEEVDRQKKGADLETR